MLNSRYLLLVAGATMLSASPAFAQAVTPAPSSTAVSAKATTYAQIVDPLTITKNVDLSFGTLVKTPALTTTPVTVTLDGADTVTCPSGLLCSGTPTSAKFTVTGTDGQKVYLKTVASPMKSGAATLTFSPSAPLNIVAVSGSTGASFTFGGSIPVASDTPSGIYTGDVTVTADYN